jgi:hypothetical protein
MMAKRVELGESCSEEEEKKVNNKKERKTRWPG